jgi:MraZ protein
MCLFLGLCLGVVAGAGLVILQLKYGSGPTLDLTAEGETKSAVEEPKALEGNDDPPEDQPEGPPAASSGVARVEGPALHTTEVRKIEPAQEPQTGAVAVEELQQRLLNYLLQHVHEVVQQGAASAPLVETLPVPPRVSESCPQAAACRPPEPIEPPYGAYPPYGTYPPAPAPAFPGTPPGGSFVWTCPPAPPPAVVGHSGEWKRARGKGERRPRVPFVGTYECTIDDQYDLKLPAEVHEMMGSPRPRTLYIEPAQDRPYLFVWTAEDLARCVERHQVGCENGDEEHERKRKLWFSSVSKVEVSADGRVQLPPDLVDDAGFAHEVVLIGVSDHFEIWDAGRLSEYLEPDQ